MKWYKKGRYTQFATKNDIEVQITPIFDFKNKRIGSAVVKYKINADNTLTKIGDIINFYSDKTGNKESKKFAEKIINESRIKLTDLINEANKKTIYKGDILKVKIWAKYGKARLSPSERVGYAKVVDLSPKKEQEKKFTFRVMGWYKSNVGWKNFIVHDFDTKDVMEIISKKDVPEEIRHYF